MAKYKVILIEDLIVGKTTIINCAMFWDYDVTKETGLRIQYYSKCIFKGKSNVTLQICDTAG